MSRAELTEQAEAKIRQVMLDLRSQDPRTRQTATIETKKLTVLYGREALEAIESAVADEAYDRWEVEFNDCGGTLWED